jgi:hypothetical protein
VIIAVLVMLPQLIFGGSTVPRSAMEPSSLLISDMTITKWSLEALGGITGLDERIAEHARLVIPVPGGGEPVVAQIETPFDNAFSSNIRAQWIVLSLFVVLFAGATTAIQVLKSRLRIFQE